MGSIRAMGRLLGWLKAIKGMAGSIEGKWWKSGGSAGQDAAVKPSEGLGKMQRTSSHNMAGFTYVLHERLNLSPSRIDSGFVHCGFKLHACKD